MKSNKAAILFELRRDLHSVSEQSRSQVRNKRGAIELETVVIFIIILVVLAFVVLLFTKYGGSLLTSLKGSTTNVVSLANDTITKLPGQ